MFKGYASQLKKDGDEVAYATVEPVRTEQHGASIVAHQFLRLIGTDAAEAASAQRDINATAHAALKGDVIKVTSGTYSGREVKVRLVATDNIYLVDDIILANGDTFEIYRHKYPTVNAAGEVIVSATLTPTPILYDLNGVDTEVKQDTATPANSRPLPVQYLNSIGVRTNLATETTVATLATQTTLAALLTELQLKADLTETQPVSVASLPLPSGAATAALQSTQDTSINTLLKPASTLAAVTNLAQLGGQAVAMGTGVRSAGTQRVTIATDDVIPLPTGAATQTTLAALLTELQLKADLTETQPVSVASLPLPSGAATSALQSSTASTLDTSINTLLKPASTLTAVTTVTNLSQQGGVAIALNTGVRAAGVQRVTLCTDDVISVKNQDGSGNAITSEAVGSNRAFHAKMQGSPKADNAVKNSGTVTSGAYVQLIAATAAESHGLTVFDSSGASLYLAVGAAGSEVIQMIIPPGGFSGFIPLRIPSGSRVSVKAVNATADYTTAELLLSLLG